MPLFSLRLLVLTLSLNLGLHAASENSATTTHSPSLPNVLLIISDDQGWEDFGFMGHPHVQTPALDRLASESLTYRRGYSPVPLCRPSLVSIATGLYPHQHGVTGNDPALPDPAVNAQAGRSIPDFSRYYQTVIAHFQAQPNFIRDLTGRGYRTLETGKWWEGDPVKVAGFSHAMTKGENSQSRHGDVGLEIGRQGLQPITRFIEESGHQPWLVWYAPMLPHTPHNPPPELINKYLQVAPTEAVARYWASIEWFDRTCGELLSYLDRKGLRENTIVVFTTDNGWVQHPDRINAFAPRSKQSPYEGGNRTPLMISWPGNIAPRLDDAALASNLDLWPTLAALLGTTCPPDLPGINLTNREAVERRSMIFGEAYAHDIAYVTAPTRSLTYRWVIDGWWKLILPDARNRPEREPELYNLQQDPWEKQNLASQFPERVQTMTRQLDAWWQPLATKK